MIDIDLFKERFKNEIMNKYGSIGNFAKQEVTELQKLQVGLRTIYRWTSKANSYIPSEDQQSKICKILKVSSSYLFPIPQNGSYANYYIGYLEGLLLRGNKRKFIQDDDPVCDNFWATLYANKIKAIYEDIDAKWEGSTVSTRPSLRELVFEKLFDDHAHREYLVELALLLVHYMGGRVSLFEQRIELAKKASAVAKELANEGPSRAKQFLSAYYLLSIDALAWIYLETGRAIEAVQVLEEISKEIDSQEWPNTSALCNIFLARAYLLAGRSNDAANKLDEIDQNKQITNEFVRVRYLMVRGDHLRAPKEGKFSAEAAFAVYSMGRELQEKLEIDAATSGLGYRQGHASVDMAVALLRDRADRADHVKNAIQDQLLSSAETIFKNIWENYKVDSADKFQALYGLARVSLARKDFSLARERAEAVITEYESIASGISPHNVLGETRELIKEITHSQAT